MGRAIGGAIAVDVHRVQLDALVPGLPPLEIAEQATAIPRAAVQPQPRPDTVGVPQEATG
jgi:hypothetical protein